jgi:hypothetical protein
MGNKIEAEKNVCQQNNRVVPYRVPATFTVPLKMVLGSMLLKIFYNIEMKELYQMHSMKPMITLVTKI